MTAFNFRSLLLAAIVLSNCITWTASRHHYAHNVHQHRTRHRRQGTGLYLPASYVIPGGEGGGPWGEWGEVSPCSRTCGGGVASQKRICLQPGSEGQPLCTGGDTKYFSCQTQDCPDGSGDFRAEQCAEFNDKAFRGFKYNWVPYTKAPNPCELNCMPHGERFYFRHKLQVTDGTKCNDESFDVCVNGKCQPVGCDMMLNSTAREDKCRVCRGNGANCRTTDGIIDTQDLMKGYNDILLIPAGSTSINIEEVQPSNNYLALRAKNGTYYLNGHYHIDFPRSIMIAGALWTYERSQQGYAAPDKLRCLGPTNEPLYLSLLLQDENVGIKYEYSVPNNLAPPTDKRYNWVHEEFTPCSATCGGGFQNRNVTCRSREELEIVDDSLCDEGLKPPTNQSCNPNPCPAQWEEGSWGECSKRCGSGGVRSREVTCQKIIANGIKSIVPDKECFDLLGPKPEVFQKCNEDAPCPTWFVGHWRPCDQLCDEGKQTRQVVCYQKTNGRVEVLDDENCSEEKPVEEQSCMLQPCDGVDWVTSSWSGCDTCTSKIRTRVVVCSTKGRQVLNESLCSYHNRPVDHEECKKEDLPACEVQWYATQWSKCSVNCGEGVQTRKVFCGMYFENDSGNGVEMVEDAKCANLTKYMDTKPCTVPKEDCPSQWFAGPWSECDKKCGGGQQDRNVMCFQGDKEASDCDGTAVLDSSQLCNTGPCDPDDLLPVSKNSTVVMGVEEDCEDEDEDYEEVGLDNLTTDTMMSDSPGYAEPESTLETGSGFGSSLSTDDLTSEGSGFSSTVTLGLDYTAEDETGSGETSITDILSSTAKDKAETTTTTVVPPTKKSGTESSESTVTEETISTESTVTEETNSTESTVTEETNSTESTITEETNSTESTVTEESSSTELTESVETGSTISTITEETNATEPIVTEETNSTESTVTEETNSTESTVTEKTSSTILTVTEETNSTEPTITEETNTTDSTVTVETGSTDLDVTEETNSTVSTVTEETNSTESTVTEKTIITESTVTEETNSTELTVTEETNSTESIVTEETSSTESTVTEETSSTESTVTEETSSTESTVTEETSSTESTVTEETSSTESTVTEETNSTESTVMEESSSTELTLTGETNSTESIVTEETNSTESIVTEETNSTESTIAEKTVSTITTESDTKETETTNTTNTEETSDTETTALASNVSTDSTTTTRAVPTDSTTTTQKVPTESNPSSTDESTTSISTSSSEGTESSTNSSESTVETNTLSEIASKSTSETESSSVESSTTLESEETTEASTTISESAETTTEAIESNSTASGFTSTESESTTESGSSVGSESTTEESESSTEESSIVSEEITTETTESAGSEESTISTYSTTEGSTDESGSAITTEETISTSTTVWNKGEVLVPSTKICKPRRKSKCKKTKFGCCPDKKTIALGPFDEGCPKPRTCKESTYGCCPDGLSPAQGDNNEGCPVEPCADTLFGCCTSDNTTAAQGNDQDGCPPPPPPCASSEYGCCADNETEAFGPDKEGCPETETSTTEALTETTTETTESIESSEGSTTIEGTTDVISTSTVDLCSGFEFGCCADNETEASGPDGQGCPCNATEFGCCPDGVSPASGPENEGCQGTCSASPHGCCQDNKTPAHGPDFEGCCLLQAFGCCPDNRKPAEGPHFEGCGCQYALHGCCPDNVTIAQGPDNQGCGCQYTQHGCCPDRHTAASGPNNEGCACNTFQFGCCNDGVTVAQGPDQHGCHCRDSKFGCCGDGETHATGPDAAGCDCSSSQYGCCPDGLTEAAGPKFLGCTDAPKNKQAACSLSTDPGPCHNFTAMWYYDMAYGGCSRFWYGGCDGNGNRFATKEDCEDVCVQPSPKDACKLPSVKGICDADYQRWYFNSTREQCIPFRYGGCLGNANNFDTRELCQKQCEPSSVEGQCNLPIDQGSCAGNYSRWGFNSEAHRCEQFIWGGCEGNSNRFSSEAACQMRCAGAQPPQCTQSQEAGNCTEKEALWSFSQSENRCLPFYYSGCGGNENRFRSRETCEQICPSAYVPDKCTLPAETGQCSNYRERWFYDTTFKRCRQFYYGGCGGNENNFGTEAECENSCSEIKTTTTTTTTTRPTEQQPQPRTEKPDRIPATPPRPEFCFYTTDAGPCNNTETRYAYDSELGRCVTFQYGGCGGNQNNFPDEAYCSFYCQPIQDICQLPMLQGPCDESVMRWFYDPTTDSCSQFAYGGCEGNENRFESLEDCENRCRTGPAPVAPTTPATTVIDGPPECRVSESLEECRYGGLVWYLDPSSHECKSHANQEAGAVCRHTGTFTSEEACERSCGAFRGVDVCKQPKDSGPCQSYVTKVYFDQSTGQCHEFIYGGCLGGSNRFSSIEECSQVCNAEIDPCTLPPEGGNCFSYIQQWYYDASRDQCNQFVYTGCSGNNNRFETQRDCEARCMRPALTTTTATIPQQQTESECKTPSSLAPCGNNVTVFYYDSELGQCLVSGMGGCGHPNSYSTEEECERSCGAFRGIDICGARLDPGPCRASIPKIYWDAMSGSCQPYAYGGCAGGPNRFSTVEECMNVCGDTGPARACLQAVAVGRECAAAPAPRWHYSAQHVDCVVFAYLGCGGNDNNFRSYAECADVCRVSRTKGDDSNQVLIPDCTPYQQECEALAHCQYGIDRFTQNGCQRCQCKEDPCVRANCASNERCVAVALRMASQEPEYSARCVAETNEVYPCDEYVANCSNLRCEYGIQRTRLPDGCEKCSCVQVEIDCEPLKEECIRLKCKYGTERIIGSDGCERCKCKEYPCERKSCGPGERCVVEQYMNGLELEPMYTAECRPSVKAGVCPMDQTTTNEVTCSRKCVDDADCRGVGKCCRRGCSDICMEPAERTNANPLLTTTIVPNVPAAPLALPLEEPEVEASEGGVATLRCLFHGNPPPKITWRFGELTIDGNAGRYRLTSDGALEIVSLYRNDTGVYICVADNGLGVATQEIHLVVNDPVKMPVGIAGDENAVVTGELGRPLYVRCLAYGYPPPSVFWYRGYEGVMVPYNDATYEARGNVLLIRSLAVETLGQYTCQAYNGEGKAASWVVFVRAYMPEGLFIESEFLIPRNSVAPRPRTLPPTSPETTTTTTSTTTEVPRPLFTVPVSTHVSTPFSTLNIGADLHLTCDVDGFPEPDVHWTKDGAILQTDGRITITGSAIVSRLTVTRVSVADSGLYACHASNPYSSQSDTAQINVQQLTVPAKCTDNPFFANCDLIVRSKFCRHTYYSKFCCKSCVEAGQLDPQEAEQQADQPLRKK